MKHLNGHLLCSIDTETTGLIPGHHDVIQIAVLPLDNQLNVSKEYKPFVATMQPSRPHNVDPQAMRVNKRKLSDLMLNSLDSDRVADLFDEWFENLNLPFRKKIAPLAQNWPFDREFIREWLGNESFNQFFHWKYRDLMPASIFQNDVASFNAEQMPYVKSNLGYLAKTLKVPQPESHDAVQDAYVTAQCYKALIYASS